MLIKIGAALTVMAQYIQRRGDTYQFCMRIPAHLHAHFGKERIRQSLNTKDAHKAAREGEKLARKYQAEFKVLTNGAKATPADTTLAGQALAEQYNLETFIDYVIEPLRAEYAQGDDYVYDVAAPSDYLSPQQMEAWKFLVKAETKDKAPRLSFAFELYLKTHQRGKEEAFIAKQQRDWKTLIAVVGDIEFKDLSRDHARHVVDTLLQQGKKTTTVRRTITNLSAVTSAAIRELAIVRTNPFEKLGIQGEGKDAKEAVVANHTQLQQIVDAVRVNKLSAPALLTLMQLEIGARIGELSGLAVADVVLDDEIPHIVIQEQPWRTLKTKVSERRVPLVGVALEAVKHALALPRNGQGEDKGNGLFEQYAHERGNDSASAAVNKRLAPWGITSHSFRHTMEDRLREAGCPEDVRNAIQGHTNGSAAEKYGKGFSLKMMREWMQKVALPITG
jgi:integrase